MRVFENRVLGRIFGPKRDEETGEGRKLYNEKLHDLYFSPNFIALIKSRRMRWAGHVARIAEMHRECWCGNLNEGKRPLENLVVF